MRIEDLTYFLEISRCGSINKAAASLNISQQGLSRILKMLENQVGTKLFNRGSKGVSLTAYGQGFQKKAEEVVRAAAELDEYVEKNRPDELSRLRVGLRISLNSSPMSSAIYSTVEDFSRHHKEIKVITHFASQEALIDELLSGDVDVVQIIGQTDDKRFNLYPILKYRLYLIASLDMGLGFEEGAAVSIRDLKDVPIVFPYKDNPLFYIIEKLFREEGIEPLIVNNEPSAKTLAHLVSRGGGAGFITQNSAEVICRMYPKVRMYPVTPETFFYYYFVMHKGKGMANASQLIEYVSGNVENNIIPDTI